jgi:hypothetical protein
MTAKKRLFRVFSILPAAALLLAAACKGASGLPERQVVSVKIDPVTAEVSRGGFGVFTAAVEVLGGASAAVTWELTGKDDAGAGVDLHPDTRIIPDSHRTDTAALYVGAGETAAVLIVTVRSREDTTLRDTAVVTLNSGPYVSAVIIAEGGVLNLNQGRTCALHGTAAGPGLTEQEKAALTWTIESAHKNGTSIDIDGKLTIAEDEPAGAVLIVRAASVKNPAKFAEINVTVLDKNAPAVVSIIVSAEGGAARVGLGGTLNFAANVTVENGASNAAAWALAGNGKSGTILTVDPADTNKAALTVASDETAATLTIRAASTVEGFTAIADSITVSVTTGAVYLIGDAVDFDGTVEWPAVPGTAADAAMTKEPGAGFTWTWTGMMRGNKTFKFHDDTATGWDNGAWYVANEDSSGDVSTAGAGSKAVAKTTASGTGNSWQTAAEGKYNITLDTAALTVTFTPIPEITAVTAVTGPDRVRLNGTHEFTAAISATHGATITWSLRGNARAGTTLVPTVSDGNKAVLTVASDETAAALILKAESPADAAQFAEKTVAVGFGDIYLIGDDFGGWGISGAASGQMMTNGLNGSYTWSGTMKRGSGFKFHDDTITGFGDGYWFNAPGNDQATTDDTHGVGITVGSETGKDWKTSHGGQYTITLNTAASTVTFGSTRQTVTITALVEGLAPGETNTFGTTLTGVDSGAGAAVTWAVTGGGISDGSNPTGTAVTNAGVLTLGSGEWIGHPLTVTATTALNETDSTTVTVIDRNVWLVGSMNSWKNDPGTPLTRTGAIFTWTGSINGGDQFRFAVSDNSDGTNWSRIWLIPTGTNVANKLYWITNGTLLSPSSVTRYDNPGPDNGCGWYLANDSGEDGPGNGNYKLTYDAVTRTLTVEKQP